MMRTVFLLCGVIALSSLSVCLGQTAPTEEQRSFSHLSVEDGLSQSSVISIVQDSAGFMWFGTRNCLNRYDSRSFKIYRHRPGDSNSISSNDYIFGLLKDTRNRLWVATQRGLDLYKPESDAFEQFYHDTLQPGSLSDSYINCLYEDRQGRIWIGTNNGLNLLTHEHPYRFVSYGKLPSGEIHAICEGRLGALWIGTAAGLTKMTITGGHAECITYQHRPGDRGSLSCNSVTSIAIDRNGKLWIGTECGGLNVFDPVSQQFIQYQHDPAQPHSISSNNIRKIIVDQENNLWIGTIDGLNHFDQQEQRFTIYRYDPENPQSLSNNSIRDLYEDKYGSIWVGTVFGGVNVTHAIATPFSVYKNSNLVNSISSNVVSAITADEKHNLWIGTEAEGVNYFDRQHGQFIHYKHDPANPASISGNFIKCIYRDKTNQVWIGTYDGGLNLFHPGSGTFTHYRHDPANPQSLPGDNISCILEDTRDRFWVGAYGKGLNLFDRQHGTFRMYTTDPSSAYRISSNWIRVLYEDRHKNLWIGTAHGLNRLPDGGDHFAWFLKSADKKDSLVSDYINCIVEDKTGNIWIGTYDGGLSLFHPDTRSFTTYTMQNGLPGNNVRGILEDGRGNLWLSTDNGLCKFNVQTKKIDTYNIYDGLPGNEFNYNSYYKDSTGQMFFGGYAGMVSFYPERIRVNQFIPPVVFTGLKLFNKPVGIRDKSHLLARDISLTHGITFSARQNIFTIDFAALNYIKSGKNRYAYKLDGFEKDWNYVDNPSATYTNLPPGRYTFLVRATNNDQLWNDTPARMQIIVLPPLWATWWAYLLYIIITAITLFFVIRFFRRQARLERDLYYEHQQKMQQQELHQMKIDFFTNISHEIRTPLALILGPIEKLMQLTRGNAVVDRQLGLARKNADRLVRLVTELLDFRKAESGHMKLWVTQANLVLFAREIFSNFEELAVSRQMSYQFETDDETIMAWFDPVQLEKVLFNLLSNTFKFTGDRGSIHLTIHRDQDHPEERVRIQVIDTGKGIPKESLSRLFERFYQAGPAKTAGLGTGIGLALSKSIIELHGGQIMVDSNPESPGQQGYTRFTILLPLGLTHFTPDQLVPSTPPLETNYTPFAPAGATANELFQAAPTDTTAQTAVAGKPTILLVEDNPEMRQMIRDALSGSYQIEECSNGREGWEMATRIIPDLVISDVMMEGVDDGFTFCHTLKQDERTNHIPVILLTARVAAVHQINGLQTGADVYLTKPFHIQVLELQVHNLLALRNVIRDKFTRDVTLQPAKPATGSAEELFLEKLVAIVEEHMEDPEFGVPMLLKKIGMSQTVLYRKLKALTDCSIADFIKSVRLKKAGLLFLQNAGSIADIAYRVGFSDRKYFSREFRKQFGQSPTEYLAAAALDQKKAAKD